MASAAPPLSSTRNCQAASPPDRRASAWLDRTVGAVERAWPWALAALMLLDAALLLYMGRGLSFFFDDWDFVTHDFGGGIHSLLAAHVGNISLFPVAIYKVLFHLVGLNHYAVFRLVVVILHLMSAGLVFLLASRRMARVPALLASVLILFLGAAWEDLLWAFQVGYLLSITGGLAAWWLVERRVRYCDLAALACLTVATGSSSLGIPFLVGIAVEIGWQRQWRRLWIVAVPTLLYLLWYFGYGESQVTKDSLINAPGYATDLMAAAFGGLVGRGLEWGRPLAVLGVAILGRRLVRSVPISARLAGLIATGVALWVITAMARSTISPPESSRYIYLGAVVIVLVAVELLRGVMIAPRALVVAAALVGIAVLTGLTVMHTGAVARRETTNVVTAELGALELAAVHAPPTYQPDPQRAPQIMAGPYLHTVRAIGSSPADNPMRLAAADATARAAADTVLLSLEVTLQPATRFQRSLLSGAPELVESAGAGHTVSANCIRFAPDGSHASILLREKTGSQLLIRAAPGPAVTVLARRFGDSSAMQGIGTASGGESSVLSLAADKDSARPWYIGLSMAQTIEACSP